MKAENLFILAIISLVAFKLYKSNQEGSVSENKYLLGSGPSEKPLFRVASVKYDFAIKL